MLSYLSKPQYPLVSKLQFLITVFGLFQMSCGLTLRLEDVKLFFLVILPHFSTPPQRQKT